MARKEKIIAMVPARYGSKRVVNKNLRTINGVPLIEYILKTISAVKCFDEVYVNSEHLAFETIAKKFDFKFHHRPQDLALDSSTNDEFGYEFLVAHQCDILVQILPTSPFITTSQIECFVEKMVLDKLDTLVSVEHKQIACIYEGKPLNFDPIKRNPPSQEMKPVKAYATALMGWRRAFFINSFEEKGTAYHGAQGRTDYFELRGISTIDIDREEDFELAETILAGVAALKLSKGYTTDSTMPAIGSTEVDVPSILEKDGVSLNDLFDVNKSIFALRRYLEEMPRNRSWSKRVIDTENNSMTVISQLPGEGNRLHFHPNWNEWWYILDGQWEWEIGSEIFTLNPGDVAFVPKNVSHKITVTGAQRAVRMAVSRADVPHIYLQRP